jgi:rod shape-determining protein MreD
MKNAVAFLCLWFGLILQSTLFQIPPINLIQPNLVLVALVLVALTRGARVALVTGVLIGLIQDAAYEPFLGLHAFTYGVIGYFAGTTFAQFLHKNVALTLLVAEICTFAENWITYGITRLFDVSAFAWRTVLSLTLEQMVVNGVVLLILYPLFLRMLTPKAQYRYKDSETDSF